MRESENTLAAIQKRCGYIDPWDPEVIKAAFREWEDYLRRRDSVKITLTDVRGRRVCTTRGDVADLQDATPPSAAITRIVTKTGATFLVPGTVKEISLILDGI